MTGDATRIEITTDDGVCPTFLYGDEQAPALLMIMDGIGMRPAIHAIAARVASEGFRVMLPDLFYRLGAYTAPEPAKLFGDPETRAAWFQRVRATMNQAVAMRDVGALLAHLPPRVGVFGYCMGGQFTIAAAASFPDRVVAAAAFHPGGLATDAPDSPHLLAPQIKARVYVAAATEDASFSDEQKQRFGDALTAAHVDHTLETYPARHGWVPSDTPVHDAACAERHYAALVGLVRAVLG